MKSNPNAWNELANEWVEIWADTGTQAWKNWMTLMGMKATEEASNHQPDSVSVIEKTNRKDLAPPNWESLKQKLIDLSQKCEKVDDWQSISDLWAKVVDLMLTTPDQEAVNRLAEIESAIASFQPTLTQPPATPSLAEKLAQTEAQNQQQAQRITQLEQQVADLQRMASIGERQLNKWRYRG